MPTRTTACPPDGTWADPLTRSERRRVAELLARASLRFWDAAAPRRARVQCGAAAALDASREMSVLYLDVTERAKVATS